MHPFDRLGTSQSALEKNDSGSGKRAFNRLLTSLTSLKGIIDLI